MRLTSSDPAMASVPATVAFTAGSTRQTFTIATTPVAQDAHVTITATTTWAQKSEFLAAEPTRHTLTVTRTSSLAILAPTVATFSFNSSSVVGGTYAGGQVTISGPAPAGGIGFGVALEGVGGGTLYYTGATIPAGATSATFSLPTPRVTNPTNVTVAITLGNRQTTSSLGLKPGP